MSRSITRRQDSLLYLGTLCWLAIANVWGAGADQWQMYWNTLSVSVLFWFPGFWLAWYRESKGEGRFEGRSRFYWWLFWGCYLPVLMVLSGSLMRPGPMMWSVVFQGGLCVAMLECVLVLTSHYLTNLPAFRWIRAMSLEKAVFLTITVWAMILGGMAVSSLDNPAYHLKEQLLIGFEFDLFKIARRFPTFLAYWAQLLLIYLAGFFFFYVNSKWLVPQILKEHGAVRYILCGLAVVGIFYPFWGALLANLPLSKLLGGLFSSYPFDGENAFGAVLVLGISLPVLLAIQWTRQNHMISALEKEKSQAELDLLTQQLNPHFFFNTLNNLYALSLQRSEQTPESILQLSDLMRYVIYKAREPLVSIAEEVRYLDDYLQLQQIRLRRHLDLRFEKEISADAARIAPLLLIVFVENAFKHGIEQAERDAFLHISLRADSTSLFFSCKNSIEPHPEAQAGIGLTNLQKRLALLYPGKHRMATGEDGQTFTAELELQFP